MIVSQTHKDAGWRYSKPAMAFHWLLAILIPFMLGVGWFMVSIEDTPAVPWYFNLHKSVGILVAVTIVLRLIWRLLHQPAPLPSQVARWQVSASKVSHWFLYAAMLAMPAFGLAGALLSDDGIAFFGLETWSFLTPNKDISEILFTAHGV